MYPELIVKKVIDEENPADVIRETSSDSDLIVIGHRGLDGVLNWILGSVAKKVVDSPPSVWSQQCGSFYRKTGQIKNLTDKITVILNNQYLHHQVPVLPQRHYVPYL